MNKRGGHIRVWDIAAECGLMTMWHEISGWALILKGLRGGGCCGGATKSIFVNDTLGEQPPLHPEDFWGTQSGKLIWIFILQIQKMSVTKSKELLHDSLMVIRIKCMVCWFPQYFSICFFSGFTTFCWALHLYTPPSRLDDLG